MTDFDVEKRTILRVRHGSHCYGLNTPTSDIDEKGVCIPPMKYHFGFLNNFEQFESMASKGGDKDLVIFSLAKFARLASQCNPNIIEMLFVDESDILYCDDFGDELLAIRNEMISKEAFKRFSGYAKGQLHRIKSHRSWLLNPPKEKPIRSTFDLPEKATFSKSELVVLDKQFESEQQIADAKDLYRLFLKEKAYSSACEQWAKYNNWLKTRNPQRAELEAKSGFDTKHGMHLIRLMRMCKEIMTDGKVNVRRNDREELLAIRNGQRSYDSVVEEAERLDQESYELYKTSSLPEKANVKKIDSLVVELTNTYILNYE